MMLVRTRVAPSSIHGMGLFAVDALPKGTPVWRFEPGFDQEFSPGQFAALPPKAQAHLRWFAYVNKTTGGWVLSGDHTCFMNHSPAPNTGSLPGATEPVTTVTLRDVAAGEELTCDYWEFDAEAGAKLGWSSDQTFH
jgi:SET domain-containing protein